MHGGLISALADNAMGLSVIEAIRRQDNSPTVRGVTTSLTLDFLGSGQIGQWIEFAPRLLKVGKALSFVDCLVLADDQLIARGSASFRTYAVARED